MSLTLAWCWKEWRAQRVLLSAYSLLVFASLFCVFLMMADEYWGRVGNGAHTLACFVTAGVIGVLLFAVPQLVRAEIGAKDDTFVRRLPGALLPAFRGKVLFLLLVAVALPLLGLVLGELFLTVTGHPWHDLFAKEGSVLVPSPTGWFEVALRWPELMVYAAWAMAVVPWVWVLATWLPGGRMAVGGTVLLALLLGLGVFAVLRRCEGLGSTLQWQSWAFASLPFGFLVAGISWVRGRRGGGNARSARVGLPLLACGLLPPAGWLGANAYEYHHPDLERPAFLQVEGFSPDLRFAIGAATTNCNWYPVKVRIDLETGAIEQIAGVYCGITANVLRPRSLGWPVRQRYWHLQNVEHEVFDLCTGERCRVDFDQATYQLILDGDLRARIAGDLQASWPFRAPGGVRVAVLGKEILFEQADGTMQREAWPAQDAPVYLTAAGHGIQDEGARGSRLYDLTRRQVISPPGLKDATGFAVRGIWLLRVKGGDGRWRRFDPDSGILERCQELVKCQVLGLFDDDRVLCRRSRSLGEPRRIGKRTVGERVVDELFLYRPADGAVTELTLPPEVGDETWHFTELAMQNGPAVAGRHVVLFEGPKNQRRGWLLIDPSTLAVEARIAGPLTRACLDGRRGGYGVLLAVTKDGALLFNNYQQVLRVDAETGAETVLFPRHQPDLQPR